MTRYVRFSLDAAMPATTPDGGESVKYGVVDGGAVFETAGRFSDDHTGASFALAKVRLLPPAWPTKIVCVGRNYADHAKELGNEPPEIPIIFLKPHSSLLAHGDSIIYPGITKHVSYEGELGVVIGKRATRVSRPRSAVSMDVGPYRRFLRRLPLMLIRHGRGWPEA